VRGAGEHDDNDDMDGSDDDNTCNDNNNGDGGCYKDDGVNDGSCDSCEDVIIICGENKE